MRTFFIVISFIILFMPVVKASGIFGSVYGGAAGASMQGYNTAIESANEYNAVLGAGDNLKKLDIAAFPEISVGYVFDTPAGGAGIYVKNALLLLYDAGTTALWPDETAAHFIKSDLSAFYSALGARFGFSGRELPGITGYAAVEGGLCHYYSNFIEEETYKEDGGVLYKIRKEWKPAFPAAAFEAGIEWKFSQNTGLGVKGGYRFASGTVPVTVKNIEGWTGPLSGQDSIDYSGFYAGAGLIFSFENEPEKKDPMKDSSFPGIAGILYKQAGEFFDEGLYRQAWQKINEAKNAAPQNSKIAELAAKIDEQLKVENKAEKVKRLIKEGDELRLKAEYGAAFKRYSEALSAEPENSHAQHYLDEMKKEGAASYEAAMALQKEGSLSKALESAKAAANYGHEGAAELKAEIEELIKKKKETNKLFNIGVEYYRKGDYKRAAESWDAVLKADPRDQEAAENLKKAWKKIDENSGQEAISEAAAAKEAADCFKLGDFNCAAGRCEYALRLNPGNKECALMLEEIKASELKTETEKVNKR